MTTLSRSRIDPLYYRLRAARPEWLARERLTLAWLRTHLADDCYLSWSGGKDSMVMVHLCRRINSRLPILCSDSGVPFRWTAEDKDLIESWCAGQGWTIRSFPWDKWGTTADAATANEDAYRRAVHGTQFVALDAWADAHGCARRVDGMRASEMGPRRIFLLRCRGVAAHSLHPLWNWSCEDVWTYMVAHSIPWLSIYDHLGPEARNNLIGRSGSTRGRLVFLRRYYPEAFRVACQKFNARDFV